MEVDRVGTFSAYFPIWNKLSGEEQRILEDAVTHKTVAAGTLLHGGSEDCIGLLVVESGQLRAYMTSEEGKELTLYRLFERDMCLFSAACMLSSLRADVMVEVEKDTALWIIPPGVYETLMKTSMEVSNYTNQLMASRFTDVMWLMDQILSKSMDARLAAFLLEECTIEESDVLSLTHERIARHMGTAREVVTRLLKYFQEEGIVKLSRGGIEIMSRKKLSALAA